MQARKFLHFWDVAHYIRHPECLLIVETDSNQRINVNLNSTSQLEIKNIVLNQFTAQVVATGDRKYCLGQLVVA